MTVREMRGVAALLLDMDGVLVGSSSLVEQHWTRRADRRGLDEAAVLALAHGSPAAEVVAAFVSPQEVAAETARVNALGHETAVERPLPPVPSQS